MLSKSAGFVADVIQNMLTYVVIGTPCIAAVRRLVQSDQRHTGRDVLRWGSQLWIVCTLFCWYCAFIIH